MTKQPTTCSHPRTHAVVIGGSMAGMLAARALVDHFDRVTIIERDRLPDQAASRKGTPQARHLHVLLERGRQVIEQLFPGLTHELVKNGASVLDTAADFSILNPAGWAVQFRSGIPMLTCSRDLLDWHVRRRLQSDPRIHFEQRVDVTRLVPDAARTGVCGIAIRRRDVTRTTPEVGSTAGASGELHAVSANEQIISADLVVDASGRGSRLPQWLESLGYDRPAEAVVGAHLGYATRVFRRPAQLADGRQGLFVQASPPTSPRAGVAVPIEGDRWIVTVSGGDGNYPPTDDAGFLDFVRSLRSSAIYDAIKDTAPLSPVFAHRGLENRLRHFERLPRWPENLIALGDAACAFNPVYAQGITTAALAVVALDECLRAQRANRSGQALIGFAWRFQKQLARVVRTPWLLATGEDRRYRKTEASKPSVLARCTHRYMDQIFRLITKSAVVRKRSLEVFHLIRHPVTLFHPGNIARVLAAVASGLARRSIQRLRAAVTVVNHKAEIKNQNYDLAVGT